MSPTYRIHSLIQQAGFDTEAASVYEDMVRALNGTLRKAAPGMAEDMIRTEIARLTDLAAEMRRSAADCTAEAHALKAAI